MPGMTDGLSMEAKIGKVLMIIGIALGILALVFLIFFGNLPFSTRFFPSHFFGGGTLILAAVKIAGIIVAISGFIEAEKKKIQRAGILAVVATLLPPLDLILLLAGLLLLISPEARKV